MKPKKPWKEDNARLRRLYLERVPKGMSQAQFGKINGIGSQSMVAQHLNGDRPLTFEAASKYAAGLHCTIYEISPSMGDAISSFLPVLGRPLRHAAVLLLAVLAFIGPTDTSAMAISHNCSYSSPPKYTMIDRIKHFFRSLIFQKLALGRM